MNAPNDRPHVSWLPAVISAVVSIGLAASATTIQLRDQSASLRERAAEIDARIVSLSARAETNAKSNERQEEALSALRTAIAEIRSEGRAIDARVRLTEQALDRAQTNRFTDRDAERLTQAIEVRIDELRRRIIQLEQAVFNRDLDGTPARGGCR